MKKLFNILVVVCGIFMFSSCSSTKMLIVDSNTGRSREFKLKEMTVDQDSITAVTTRGQLVRIELDYFPQYTYHVNKKSKN